MAFFVPLTHYLAQIRVDPAPKWADSRIMSKFDPVRGLTLKNASQSSWSLGVQRQHQLRTQADADGFVELLLWTDIGKTRSGAGGALIGSAGQIIEKINRYTDMGIRAFDRRSELVCPAGIT